MPGKAAWTLLEDDPDLEFEFFLAEKLSRSVAEIRQMSSAEFLLWTRFYARKAQAEELQAKSGG